MPYELGAGWADQQGQAGLYFPILTTPTIPEGLGRSAAAAAEGNREANETQQNLHHTNPFIEAALERSRDEVDMQNMLQRAQRSAGIYNTEIEPEHEADWPCKCAIHLYKNAKLKRKTTMKMWSKAALYPGEATYDDLTFSQNGVRPAFSKNPYAKVASPYGTLGSSVGITQVIPRPKPGPHAKFIRDTVELNAKLNKEAQDKVDTLEPNDNIWLMRSQTVESTVADQRSVDGSTVDLLPLLSPASGSKSKPSGLLKFLGVKSAEQKTVAKAQEVAITHSELRDAIVREEMGRWPTDEWRQIVHSYLSKMGIFHKVIEFRTQQPLQYLHLLRAGYFEPIPLAWATMNGSPLKFLIDTTAGWRGITPQWRGYEDIAEERLYWVLNHHQDETGTIVQRLKPDFISRMDMARNRMENLVEPPSQYYSAEDACFQEQTAQAYSKQILPAPFHAFDRPEVVTDDTMVLLDVSGSMDFKPARPTYDQYLITGWTEAQQPKNKSLAKAILRRFIQAMTYHDKVEGGYDFVTFATKASHIGKLSRTNFEEKWNSITIGGGTRVMLGWQKVKELHFEKYRDTATFHPVLGWQASTNTPMLRLLVVLDGEARDMDEFELDLLGLDWAHVTIFLIGVEDCLHHHRHANELQRISAVNHHVSFIDAQGNTPERFVTHELLKRHLGYDISMEEFEALE